MRAWLAWIGRAPAGRPFLSFYAMLSVWSGMTAVIGLPPEDVPGLMPYIGIVCVLTLLMGALLGICILMLPNSRMLGLAVAGVGGVLAVLFYVMRMKGRVVDDLVVNMVDVGEETGELDTMLYKVADYFDEEVRVLTDGLTKLMEPLLIVFLGVAVGFIVISLFMPLVSLIQGLT